jgi:ABC-type glycerol-3-phosphate transport system substrate-binding protein
MTTFHRRGAAFGLAAALVLTGCGSQDTAGSDSAEGGSADEGPITLQVMSATVVEKPDGAAEEAMADAFMAEHPDITIEFIGTPMNEMYAKLSTMATGGNMPDIFTNSPEFYGQADDMGVVEPLNDLLGQDYVDGFEPATIAQAEIDDKLQFAPFFTIPTGLLYRTDLFEAEGIEPPETWDEFVEAAQKLTQDLNGDGQTDRWGFAMVGSNNGSGGSRFVPVMRTFGAEELVEKDGGWATEYGTPEAAAAFQLYSDLVNKYEVVPPGPFQTSYAEAVSLMATDKTAMMISGPHSIGAITAANPELEGKLAGVPLPHAPGEKPAAALGMLGFSISAQSKHKEAAAEYLKFILNKENQLEWNKVTGRLPARTEAAEDPQIQRPELKGFLDAQQYAFTMPQVPFYADVQLAATEGYQAVISGSATAEEAAELAATKTETLIQQHS